MGCTLLSLFGSGADLGAHVNVKGGKAFCFTKGPDSDAIRRAHEKLNFPFDSITEVKRVTGADLRPELTDASTSKLTGFAFKRRVNGGMEPRYVQPNTLWLPVYKQQRCRFYFSNRRLSSTAWQKKTAD